MKTIGIISDTHNLLRPEVLQKLSGCDLILHGGDISGPQVLEMIRSEYKVDKIPVIFLTGKGDRESVMKVVSLKPDGYFLKSASRDALLKGLHEFFEKRRYEMLHQKGVV